MEDVFLLPNGKKTFRFYLNIEHLLHINKVLVTNKMNPRDTSLCKNVIEKVLKEALFLITNCFIFRNRITFSQTFCVKTIFSERPELSQLVVTFNKTL